MGTCSGVGGTLVEGWAGHLFRFFLYSEDGLGTYAKVENQSVQGWLGLIFRDRQDMFQAGQVYVFLERVCTYVISIQVCLFI